MNKLKKQLNKSNNNGFTIKFNCGVIHFYLKNLEIWYYTSIYKEC